MDSEGGWESCPPPTPQADPLPLWNMASQPVSSCCGPRRHLPGLGAEQMACTAHGPHHGPSALLRKPRGQQAPAESVGGAWVSEFPSRLCPQRLPCVPRTAGSIIGVWAPHSRQPDLWTILIRQNTATSHLPRDWGSGRCPGGSPPRAPGTGHTRGAPRGHITPSVSGHGSEKCPHGEQGSCSSRGPGACVPVPPLGRTKVPHPDSGGEMWGPRCCPPPTSSLNLEPKLWPGPRDPTRGQSPSLLCAPAPPPGLGQAPWAWGCAVPAG